MIPVSARITDWTVSPDLDFAFIEFGLAFSFPLYHLTLPS